MRYSVLFSSLVGAIALTSACAHKDKGPDTKEVRAEEEAQKEGTKEENKGIVERVRERIGFDGCDLEVVTASANAVGDPCQTTAGFMKEKGLSDEQIEQVNRYAAMIEARGETRQAH